MKRISKNEAKNLWIQGKEIGLLSCNLMPGMMWQPCFVNMLDYVKSDFSYSDDTKLELVELAELTWNKMYNNWYYYNANHEMGYYAHYYKKGE